MNEKEIKDIIRKNIENAKEQNKHTKVFKILVKYGDKIPEEVWEELLDTYKAKNIIGPLSEDLGFSNADELVNKFLEESKNEKNLASVFGEITKTIEKL